MSRVGDMLDRLSPRPLVVVSGLAMAATWAVQKLLMNASAEFLRTAVTADREHAAQLIAASSLQTSLNTVSLVCGVAALPGLLVLWRSVVRSRAKTPMFLVLIAIAWPALAAAELAFHCLGGGAFPVHDLVVGAPFVTAAVAALFLAGMRAHRHSVSPWSIAVYALALSYFVLPRFLNAIPVTDPDRARLVSVGGLVLLAVLVGPGLLVCLMGLTMTTSTRGGEASEAAPHST